MNFNRNIKLGLLYDYRKLRFRSSPSMYLNKVRLVLNNSILKSLKCSFSPLRPLYFDRGTNEWRMKKFDSWNPRLLLSEGGATESKMSAESRESRTPWKRFATPSVLSWQLRNVKKKQEKTFQLIVSTSKWAWSAICEIKLRSFTLGLEIRVKVIAKYSVFQA